MQKCFFRLSLMPHFCSTVCCFSRRWYVCGLPYVSTHVILPLHQHCCSCSWVKAVQEPAQAKNWTGKINTVMHQLWQSRAAKWVGWVSWLSRKLASPPPAPLDFSIRLARWNNIFSGLVIMGYNAMGGGKAGKGQQEPVTLGRSQGRTAEERGKGTALFCSISPLERTGVMHPLSSLSCLWHCTRYLYKHLKPALLVEEMTLPSPSPWALLLSSTAPSFLALLVLQPCTELERKTIPFKTKQLVFNLDPFSHLLYQTRRKRALCVECYGEERKER